MQREKGKGIIGSTLAVLKSQKEEEHMLPICPYCNKPINNVKWLKSDVGEEFPLTIIFCPLCGKVFTAHF